MKSKIPLVIAVLALTTAVFGIFRDPDPRPAAPVASMAPASISQAPTSAPEIAPQPVLPTPLPPGTDEALVPLLKNIQDRLIAMENRMNHMTTGWEGLARRGLVPLSDEDKTKFQLEAMNSALPLEQRLSALRLLRRHNAVTDEVADTIASLAMNTTDPELKAEIFNSIDGMTNNVLAASLVNALADEQDSGVRRRIVDALSSFSSDPDVADWLRHVIESDSDDGVKREAREALERRMDRMEPAALQQVVLQEEVSLSEKINALARLRREDARTPEVVAAMTDLYNGTQDSRSRVEILRHLDGVSDPALLETLITGLAEDQNARVREEAADVLSGYKSDPNVLAWLQHAAANDPDERVKRQAQAVLDGTDDGGDRRREWGRRGGGRRGR